MIGKTAFFSRDTFEAIIDLKPAGKQRRKRRRTGSAKPGSSRMISVIIPAHNEEAYLGQTLDAVNRQHYPNFEVLVIANGCTDRTAAVARDHGCRLIVLPEKGLGLARNLGAGLARGEILLFLDADTLLEPAALATIARQFTRDCAAGTIKGCPDGDRLSFRLIYGLKNFIHRWSIHGGSSGVILCWKEQFMAAHGFDEALQVRENSDLINRLKRFGKYRYIGQTTAVTSMRRYENAGTARTVWLWFKLWLQSCFGDLRHKEYDIVR